MNSIGLKRILKAALVIVFAAMPSTSVMADGTEEINSIPGLADGTGIVAAGVGLFGGDVVLLPGSINFTVPLGASVPQVLL